MNRVSPVSFVWGGNKNWANANKTTGAFSIASGLIGTTCGCIKACTDETSFLNKFFGFIQSIAYGFRNYFQYSIYSRKEDDDLGEDIHKIPFAAKFGEVACFIEKNVNPFALPIINLLGKRASESYNSISHLANALWWRGRLFLNRSNWEFPNKNLIYFLKDLFDSDIEEKDLAAKEIEKIIAPICGITGFFTTSVFNIIKASFKLVNRENKIINFLASVGTMTQHIDYLFRFSLTALINYQGGKSQSNNKLLASLGFTANTLNIALPLVEFFPSDNTFLGKFHNLYQELATGFTAAFFSTRRHFMGKEWLEKNVESVEEVVGKIVKAPEAVLV